MVARTRAGKKSNNDDLNATIQRLFLVVGGIGIYPVLFIGMALLRFLPPPSPAQSAAHFDHQFAQHSTAVQFGCLLMSIGLAAWGLWAAVVTVWVRRMESRRYPVLTIAAVLLAGACALVFELTPMLWALAGYRAGQAPPDVTRALDDIGWFLFSYDWPIFTFWYLVVGIAILQDRNEPSLLPRWVGREVILTGLSLASISTVGFVKTGPFAINGLFSLWFPITAFVIGDFILTCYLLKAIAREERSGPQGGAEISDADRIVGAGVAGAGRSRNC
jgi:hypothetical protein